jgi:hypothetical protein
VIVPVQFVGKTGLIIDQPPYDLPPNFWNDCRNVRFELGGIERAPSWRTLTTFGGSPIPYGLFFVHSLIGKFWVYTGLQRVVAIAGGTVTDITRLAGSYTGGTQDFWQGGMFNDHLILNNGVDVPQNWDLPNAATALADLPNWPATHRAKIVTPFKEFLVALDVTISGERDDRLVMWSHPADPLNIPPSWDVADETLDAGQVSLSEGEDRIIDGLQVGNQLMIVTGAQTWAMIFIGGQDVMAFRRVFSEIGALAQGCATTFLNKVFQVTADDFVIHDLQSVTSIGYDRTKRWFFSQLTPSSYDKVRVVRKMTAKEIWITYSYGGTEVNNRALVWNWQFDTWTIRDIEDNHHAISAGPTSPTAASNSWASAVGTWAAQDPLTWESNTYDRAVEGLALASTALRLRVNGDTVDVDDSTVNYVERIGVAVKGLSRGEIVIDHGRLAVMREIWPKFVCDDGHAFSISVGFSMNRKAPVAWQPAQTFIQGTTMKLGFFGTFRYLSYRVECFQPGTSWKLIGFDLDLEPTASL